MSLLRFGGGGGGTGVLSSSRDDGDPHIEPDESKESIWRAARF